MPIDRKAEEALSERHSKRVLAMAGRVALAVCLVQPLILDRDVGRITYHDVILLPQNTIDNLQVFDAIRMPEPFSASRMPCLPLEVEFIEAPPVQQAVTHGYIEAKAWRVAQGGELAGLQGATSSRKRAMATA
jgi:hypothetical protein